ncbi:aldo/keto reductase [Streptomyces sp. NPDC050355]|uniref:aldo/keto reductase n=1 Tax=Streptomyces sp. NPDC050355 TaxID=3365609 RepID=UPI003791B365
MTHWGTSPPTRAWSTSSTCEAVRPGTCRPLCPQVDETALTRSAELAEGPVPGAGHRFRCVFRPLGTAARGGRGPGARRARPPVARAHDATPAQVRLAWTLHRGPQVPVVAGTTHPAHLTEDIAAGALRLTEEEPAALDEPGEGAAGATARCGSPLA